MASTIKGLPKWMNGRPTIAGIGIRKSEMPMKIMAANQPVKIIFFNVLWDVCIVIASKILIIMHGMWQFMAVVCLAQG